MERILSEYVKIIGYVFTGVVFGLAFFLLFSNFYHYTECDDVYINDGNHYSEIDDKLKLTRNNLNVVNSNMNNADLNILKEKINSCLFNLDSIELKKYLKKQKISMKDSYDFLTIYQNKIVDDCLKGQLRNIISDSKVGEIQESRPFIILNIDQLIKDLDYTKKTLYANSSYNFNNSIRNNGIYRMVEDSYNDVFDSYKNVIDLIYNLSCLYYKEIGDNYE